MPDMQRSNSCRALGIAVEMTALGANELRFAKVAISRKRLAAEQAASLVNWFEHRP